MYVHMNEKQDQSVNARVDALNMCQYCVCVSYIHKRMHTHTRTHTHTHAHTLKSIQITFHSSMSHLARLRLDKEWGRSWSVTCCEMKSRTLCTVKLKLPSGSPRKNYSTTMANIRFEIHTTATFINVRACVCVCVCIGMDGWMDMHVRMYVWYTQEHPPGL